MKKIISTILLIGSLANVSVLRAENVGVPSECEDVMLQAFYWDSYTLTKYGRTKWVDLLKDTAAINASFDLVWLPPSASSSGGVGYIPAKMDNQESDWGQKSTLTKFITGLRKGKTKVIGDIVINHRGNKSTWCDFHEDRFGIYGTFQLTQQHMCKNDEGFTKTSSSCYGAPVSERGAADTGTNFEGARDLDHSSEYVQSWAKAYLKWMKSSMKYEGFRFDMTLGYSGSYLSMYNQEAQPYISVSEYWESIDKQVTHLQQVEYNTMIFDFPLKYVMGNAFKTPNYRLLVNPANSLRGKGYGKYAVTFIDNHDTFERSDAQTQEFIGYNVDLTDATNKNKILQANAYILMLPGIPCVFWPHWKSYQEEIDALIAVRKKAGIHSESAISEKSENNVYEATVDGHRGTVILRLGANRSKDVPEGFELALEGGDVAAYTIFIAEKPQGLETLSGVTVKGEKFLQNGQLFIRVGEKVFDVTGKQIQ